MNWKQRGTYILSDECGLRPPHANALIPLGPIGFLELYLHIWEPRALSGYNFLAALSNNLGILDPESARAHPDPDVRWANTLFLPFSKAGREYRRPSDVVGFEVLHYPFADFGPVVSYWVIVADRHELSVIGLTLSNMDIAGVEDAGEFTVVSGSFPRDRLGRLGLRIGGNLATRRTNGSSLQHRIE